MTPRHTNEVLANTLELVKYARLKADLAWWEGHPAAARFEREAKLLEERYASGELVTPKF